MRRIVFLSVCSLFFFSACKKEPENPMPSPTQSGKNILACKVNGSIHIYEGIATYLDDNGVNFLLTDYTDSLWSVLIIADDKKYNDEMTFAVTLRVNQNTVKPLLGSPYYLGKRNMRESDYFVGNGNHEYYPDSTNSYVTFTRFDNIAAGTFEFHGVNDSNKKVDITEGFFDISR